MTTTQVWSALCSYIFQLFPDCLVKKQYTPIEDFEELANTNRPIVWVGLASTNIESVDVNAQIVEDSYTFRLILAWKLRNNKDQLELDNRLNAVQQFLTLFRHKGIDVDGTRLYFGLPSCTSPYDEDFLTSPGVFVSTCSVQVSIYRDLKEVTSILSETNETNSNESGAEEVDAVAQDD